MNSTLQEIVFLELKNRFNQYMIAVIRNYFKGEDVKDIFQEVQLHLYKRIGELYDEQPDLFSTKVWIGSVVSKFCISEIRKRNGKKKVKLVFDETSLNKSHNYELIDFQLEKNNELNQAIKDFLSNLSKRDALILKMKYSYGKSSNYISVKMNETHINVYIQRIKERLIRRTGISDIEEFVTKYNTYL
jgi:RNA polymerase sigma factor (sigma-70 family)